MATRSASLRRRGSFSQGRVPLHRSIFSLHLPLHRLGLGFGMALAFTVALVAVQLAIETAWHAQMVWWMHALELPGQYEPALAAAEHGLFTLKPPFIDLALPELGWSVLAQHALVVVAVWAVSGWLPESARPAAYLLRFAVLIHGTSVVYFLFWPGSFAHSALSHAGYGLTLGWALMLLTPWLHLVTYYLFPFAVWQRVALTAVTLVFVFVHTPLQYASHLAIVSKLGLVALPVLHLLLGVMVPIVGMVALYGWGMSWHDPSTHHAAARRPGAP